MINAILSSPYTPWIIGGGLVWLVFTLAAIFWPVSGGSIEEEEINIAQIDPRPTAAAEPVRVEVAKKTAKKRVRPPAKKAAARKPAKKAVAKKPAKGTAKKR